MILTGETCEVSKTSQVFGDLACHDYCGRVLVHQFINMHTVSQTLSLRLQRRLAA